VIPEIISLTQERKGILLTGLVLMVLLLSLGETGCKKHEPATESTKPSGDQEAAAAVPSPRGPPAITAEVAPPVVAENSDINAVLHDLSLELRKYVVRTHSIPKTFEEFAAKSHVQMPPAPGGKKYAIQGQAVVLVKN
jgi:hypothetical protein